MEDFTSAWCSSVCWNDFNSGSPWRRGQSSEKRTGSDSQQTLTCHHLILIHITEYLWPLLYVLQAAHYAWNKTEFDAIDPETTDYLMGGFFFSFLKHFAPREGTDLSVEDQNINGVIATNVSPCQLCPCIIYCLLSWGSHFFSSCSLSALHDALEQQNTVCCNHWTVFVVKTFHICICFC